MKSTITYTLDDAGRKALLVAGGDGKAEQKTTIDIQAGDIDLMSLASDGSLSADARSGAVRNYWGSWNSHEFSAVPTPAELIAFLRQRVTLRGEAEALYQSQQAAKKAAEMAKAAQDREAAILDLRQALADGRILAAEYGYISANPNLKPTDPDCGVDVQRMIDLYQADKTAKAGAAKRLEAIKAVAHMPYSYPTTPVADGKFSFECPTCSGDGAWAKHLESIDTGAKDGYCFEGPWLRHGSQEILAAGELVICGSKSWSGSRQRGSWSYSKELYLVTPAGLIKLADDDDCKAIAMRTLAQDIPERLEKSLKSRAKTAREKVAALKALDRTEYAGELARIDARIAVWQAVADACDKALVKALETPAQDEAITDIDSAAAAIVAAGYRALAKIHHPDAGTTGSDATMALLSAARAQLRDMLKLAGVK